MIPVLIISPNKDTLTDLANRLNEENDITVQWADSGKNALETISHDRVEFVIVDHDLEDMPGLEFAERLVKKNPMINCAAISNLSDKEFHEASEGLGLMAQLPIRPDRAAAEYLIIKLRKIKNLF
jgi:DNA-binding NtrC family response regulator